jgi:hypothetical protein
MSDDFSHHGARSPGLFTPPVDRRIQELDDVLRGIEVSSWALPNLGIFRDPGRVGRQNIHNPIGRGSFLKGMVVHAIPGFNWYKVQCGEGAGFIGCSALSQNLTPIGPRELETIAPYNQVLVYIPHNSNYGIIIGVIPPSIANGNIFTPDWIFQGGGSGLKREELHMFPVSQLFMGGGIIDHSAGRPLDATGYERGWTTSSGLLLTIDEEMMQMRVNEMCGLMMTLFDSYCRLSGVQLDIESAIHGEYARDDEGEARHTREIATYPWEALGLYKPGSAFTKEFDDQEVQYKLHRGKVDLAEGDESLQAVTRWVERGGYLGQGHIRALLKPAKEEGKRHYIDKVADEGLFCEAITLDGDYSLRSAKSVHIGKRVRIVVPKEMKLPEDGTGDDAAADNYRFSGMFGSGPEHKIQNTTVTGDFPNMRRVAAVNDLITYLVNWKVLHPFHYHQNDFYTPQETAQNAHFQHTQSHLDFAAALDEAFMDTPQPVPLNIDHRYGNVDFFERESFLMFHEDGSVQMGCAYGAQLLLAGGDLYLSAPRRIIVEAGADLITLSDQVCIRAKDSLDLSSAKKDIRIKAEQNMQLLAGNAGNGGILLESKALGDTQDYSQKIGEDVISSGVVMRSNAGIVAALQTGLYLRTGGKGLSGGNITLDAGKGENSVQIYAADFHTYTTSAVTFDFGPHEENSTVNKSYIFDGSTCFIEGQLIVGDEIVAYNGGIIISGDITSGGSIQCTGSVADAAGGLMGKSDPALAGIIQGVANEVKQTIKNQHQLSTDRHQQTIVQTYYQPTQIGSSQILPTLQFSFRDNPNGDQYHVENLRWLEPRWQMLVRFGLASGGTSWDEPPVLYQGEQTFPYPGKKKWLTEDAFLRLSQWQFFDGSTGSAKDRPYESALADWKPTTMAEGYRLLR